MTTGQNVFVNLECIIAIFLPYRRFQEQKETDIKLTLTALIRRIQNSRRKEHKYADYISFSYIWGIRYIYKNNENNIRKRRIGND